MAFKTKGSRDIPSEQFNRALGVAAQVKSVAQAMRTRAAGGAVSLGDIESNLLATLRLGRVELIRASQVPGIVAHARGEFDDLTYDIATEFTAMMAQINALLVWLEANFPTDASGHLQSRKFVGDGSGALVDVELTAAPALAAFITRVDALIASID